MMKIVQSFLLPVQELIHLTPVKVKLQQNSARSYGDAYGKALFSSPKNLLMKTSHTLNGFVITCLLVFLSVSLRAQTAFGIKGGITASNIIFTSDVGLDESDEDFRFSAHFGYLMRTYITDRLFFQPELLYMEKGYKGDYTDINGEDNTATVRFWNVNLPLLLGFQFHNFQLAAGPEIEYFFKAHSKANGEDYGVNPAFGKNTWLFNANLEAGYQIDRFQLSLRGSLGLRPILEGNVTDVNGLTIGGFSYRNVALQAAVAYMIFE